MVIFPVAVAVRSCISQPCHRRPHNYHSHSHSQSHHHHYALTTPTRTQHHSSHFMSHLSLTHPHHTHLPSHPHHLSQTPRHIPPSSPSLRPNPLLIPAIIRSHTRYSTRYLCATPRRILERRRSEAGSRGEGGVGRDCRCCKGLSCLSASRAYRFSSAS
jgi:hypothetical protein